MRDTAEHKATEADCNEDLPIIMNKPIKKNGAKLIVNHKWFFPLKM